MYNTVFVRLLMAAIVTFVVIFGATYFYVVQYGRNSPRGIAPALGAFFQAAANSDSVTAHRMLSSDLLRSSRLDAIDAMLRLPQQFYGYQGVRLVTYHVTSGSQTGGLDTATVHAIVSFSDGEQAPLDATLVRELDNWRIDDMTMTPRGSSP
jgi:hypothetical protein